MASVQTQVHVTTEELAAYFSGQLRPEQETSYDEHFATCETCVREARHFRVGLESRFRAFSVIWNVWTAGAHKEVRQNDALNAALQQAIPVRPEWQARLRRWQERWSGATESALQLIGDAAREASRVIIQGLETRVSIGTEWHFALATEAPSISSSARSGGVPIRGAFVTNRSVSREAEKPHERVTVSDTGEIEVIVDGWQPGRPASLVLLVDLQGNHPPLVQELIEESAGIAVARFTGVTPGEYVVAFEPEE